MAPRILTSMLDGGEWSASRPCHLTPGDRATVLIGLQAGWAPEPI
jgi:hypothetical protein